MKNKLIIPAILVKLNHHNHICMKTHLFIDIKVINLKTMFAYFVDFKAEQPLSRSYEDNESYNPWVLLCPIRISGTGMPE
jgi:hypothetical protein